MDPRQAPAVAPVTEATGVETDTEVEEASAVVESPPTPSMDHSDGDSSEMESDVEGYSIDRADSWAIGAYPIAGGVYHPTPVQLTNEYAKLEDRLEKTHEESVKKLKKIEDRREELVEKLRKTNALNAPRGCQSW